ncbi:pentapeptide repeat-containing protein [Lentzea sp. NEAU-D13]|uniref:Pentapeptide repeat-containing protein n=1 Tax=Lentzea alba TaxID=2714351 RepID=A0A7C9VSV0_9PSEU|nr:pentapeptide repeat-containing protein [Lentzea alba]NGY59976.1 pentapeptide repeat-containing protein [Lentzea alba]
MLLLAAIVVVPELVIAPSLDVQGSQVSNARAALRGNLLQAFGGLFFITTAVTAWWQLRLNQQTMLQRSEEISSSVLHSAEQLRIANETLSTDRFSRAVGHLGDPSVTLRLGGVYALTRLADSSDQDRLLVIDVLCAFIRTREHGTEGPGPVEPLRRRGADVQAALTFLANLPKESGRAIDLSGADLRGCDVVGARLRRADLSHARLDDAVLIGADLTDADLHGARFDRAMMSGARLDGADLGESSFAGADLTGARVNRANLTGADFAGATLAAVSAENVIGRLP